MPSPPASSACPLPHEARRAGWMHVCGFCLLAVVASRILLFGTGVLGLMWNGMPVDPVGMWVRWDASFYLDIAANGYSQSPLLNGPLIGAANVAFFPLYPLAMRVVGLAIPDPRLAGIALSSICLLLACMLLYQVAAHRGGPQAGRWTVAALVAFPGSFVFSGVMSESTYLLLTVAGFYFAHRNRFVAAGLAAALAAVSRSLGILMVPCLLLEQVFPSRYSAATAPCWRAIAILMTAPLLLAGHMTYLWWRFGDAFAFLNVQIFWWRQFTNPLANIWDGLTAGDPTNLLLTVFGVVALGLLAAGARWLSAGELTFAAANIMVSFGGSAASMPRYVVGQFPIYLVLGLAACRYPRLRLPLFVLLALGNGALIVTWVTGYDLFI